MICKSIVSALTWLSILVMIVLGLVLEAIKAVEGRSHA